MKIVSSVVARSGARRDEAISVRQEMLSPQAGKEGGDKPRPYTKRLFPGVGAGFIPAREPT